MPDVPARHLNLQGASNFRDLGGYAAHDGRFVRWRQMFRSNHLGHLTAADIEIVRALGVRHAFDLRGLDERAGAACGLSEITVHSLPIEPTVVAALQARLAAGSLSASDAEEIMRDSYRNYVRHDTHSFRKLFAHLLDDSAPLVIHCTAGKDRTGFACALVLHALGVPDEVIGEDYLLTNRFYRSNPSSATDLPNDIRQGLRRPPNLFHGGPWCRRARTRKAESTLSAVLSLTSRATGLARPWSWIGLVIFL